ncbi:MAG TPA: hypothetical protein VF796_08675, partial [Humisphaera sp.]
MSRPKSNVVLSSRWTPLGVLLLGAACTAAATVLLADAARQRDQERFENAARRVAAAADDRVRSHLVVLRAVAGRVTAEGGYTSRSKFHDFVEALPLHDCPGVREVGFVRRVGPGELGAFVDEFRAGDPS